jgi:hypothetical protein
MNKLRLNPEELTVDTFVPGEQNAPGGGTVAAHAATEKIICAVPTLKTDLTCCPCTPMI